MTSGDETPVPYYLRPNENQRAMNARLAELIAEADSSLVVTPMARHRWYSPEEEWEKGIPCFIPADYKDKKNKVPPPMKQDYIWMRKRGKDLPAGYYHFSTQESYVELWKQFQRRKSLYFYLGRGNRNQKLDKQIHYLLESRLLTDKPSDQHAIRMRHIFAKVGGCNEKNRKLMRNATMFAGMLAAASLGNVHLT